jgi:two-component system sensor histidine kinase/response regulator
MLNTEPSSPNRLLIIDDDPNVFTMLRTHLAPLGYQIATAEDESSALAQFAADPPDLVLLDLMMPGIGGLGILAQIRGAARGLYVPVIFLTSHSQRELRLLALRAGADEFLEKPIDAPILLARVTTLLKLKASRDQLELARDAVNVRNMQLERLQCEQRELLQFVVHDLKNQLFVVLMSFEAAQSTADTYEYVQLTDILSEGLLGAERLRTMVEDMLAVSRLEDAFPVQVERMTAAELIGPILAAYQRKAELSAVTLTPPSSLDWMLSADPALLRRVLENVLDNALRYTSRGGHIGIEARLGETIQITIGNDGPAVAAEERDSIFKKFVRGQSETPTAGNTGLGLYFCKRAMDAQGGSIRLEQTDEWPTSFVLELVRPS